MWIYGLTAPPPRAGVLVAEVWTLIEMGVLAEIKAR